MPINKPLLDFLSQFVTDHKKELLEKILDNRTRQLTVVLEDIFQSQNASAIVRTCECLGIQDIHIIESLSKYGTNLKVVEIDLEDNPQFIADLKIIKVFPTLILYKNGKIVFKKEGTADLKKEVDVALAQN